jgi:hypothetical protein
VEDELDASDGVVDALVAAELALDDLDVVLEAGEVRAVAGGEVVEDANRVAAFEQLANEVRADEATAAGDEDAAAQVSLRDTVRDATARPSASQRRASIGTPAKRPRAASSAAATTSHSSGMSASGGPRR